MRIVAWLCLVLMALLICDAQQHTTGASPGLLSTQNELASEAVDLRGLVRLDVQITDDEGHSVSGLERGDFTALDNGQPQPIVAFRRSREDKSDPNQSVHVDLLIDTLDLPPDFASFERSETVAFLRQNNGRLACPVTIYSLEDTGFFLTGRSSVDGNALADAVASKVEVQTLFVPRQVYSRIHPLPVHETFLRFPPFTALRALGAIATDEDRKPGRKVLLWIGPGFRDGGTGAYLDTAASHFDSRGRNGQQDLFSKIVWFSMLLRQARITVEVFSVGELGSVPADVKNPAQLASSLVSNGSFEANAWNKYVAGVLSPDQASVMNLYKKVLAVESGGRVLPPARDLVHEINDCVRGADTYFTLTFDPPPAAHADEYHRLEVKLARPGLTAHTNTGYYNEPFYTDSASPSIQRRSVAQVQQILKAEGRRAAAKLGNTELTERITEPTMQTLLTEVRGDKTREALQVTADEAAFLPPPAGEILDAPPPSPNQRVQILSAAARYLRDTIPRLPDFFAAREAVLYGETVPDEELNTAVDTAPLHTEERSKATILYRHGEELVNGALHNPLQEPNQLVTYGTFGSILRTVQALLVLPRSLVWSRWERISGVRRALFRYSVVANDSQYRVSSCCAIDAEGADHLSLPVAYHGEIAIDPTSGAILRVQLQFDVSGIVPIDQSSMMVSYGPIVIGNRTWIVPLHSVSIARVRTVKDLGQWNLDFHTWGPFETQINDFTFSHYRKFQGTVRILPGIMPASGPQ